MNTVEQVSAMQIELDHLRAKSDADDSMVALLREQNELYAMELSKMANDHAEETRKLKQRCNLAVQREKHIDGLLNTVAVGIVSGLRKMKGEETPEQIPDRPTKVSDHAKLPQNVMPDAYAPPKFRPVSDISHVDNDLNEDVRALVRSLPPREVRI